MRFLPFAFSSMFGIAIGGGAMLACSVSDEAGDGGAADDSYGTGGGYPTGDASIDVPAGGAPNMGAKTYADLCGIDVCVPGDGNGCRMSGGGSGVGGSSVGGAAGGQAPGGAGQGGLGGSGGGLGGGGQGGTMGGAPSEPTGPLGCQVQLDDDGRSPISVCAEVGSVGVQGACNASLPCGPGLACVISSDTTLGQCFPYCCGDLEACPADTHCVPQNLLSQPLQVPVCKPVTPCELLNDSTCPNPDETCAVVRDDGTTSCVPVAGTGAQCDPCPCGPGYICGELTNTCKKLCHTDDSQADECGAGSTCQGGVSSLPEGFGICVGGAADVCL